MTRQRIWCIAPTLQVSAVRTCLEAFEGRSQSSFRPVWDILSQYQAPINLARTLTHALDFPTHPDIRLSQELRRFKEAIQRSGVDGGAEAKGRWHNIWNKILAVDAQIAGPMRVNYGKRLRVVLGAARWTAVHHWLPESLRRGRGSHLVATRTTRTSTSPRPGGPRRDSLTTETS